MRIVYIVDPSTNVYEKTNKLLYVSKYVSCK